MTDIKMDSFNFERTPGKKGMYEEMYSGPINMVTGLPVLAGKAKGLMAMELKKVI
jgi:hypothetical protein